MTLFSLLASAVVLLSLNSPDGVYASGDTVRVYATVDGKTEMVHEQVYTGPDNIIFKYEDTCIGWVVEPESYRQSLPCPKDFDRFWKREIRTMRRLPMNARMEEVKVNGEDNYICYAITLDCVDNTPVRGYIAMPRNAARRSLPIVVYTHAAGVAGSWCRCTPQETIARAKWGNGAISIDFNAFGMENGREQSYYDQLENGELYMYSHRPSKDRESFLFKNMYLRCVRALDFACGFEQWDGKRVLHYGQSQGGAQAFALAGLDKRVTAVVAIVPAGCNTAGSVTGGHDSWPFIYQHFETPELGQKVLPYFDGCNFLALTKAELFIELGLMDNTCYPEAIYSAINANHSKKVTVLPSPWRYHNEPDPRYWNEWNTTIAARRYEFINDYLK